jgi:hypothetical protein
VRQVTAVEAATAVAVTAVARAGAASVASTKGRPTARQVRTVRVVGLDERAAAPVAQPRGGVAGQADLLHGRHTHGRPARIHTTDRY